MLRGHVTGLASVSELSFSKLILVPEVAEVRKEALLFAELFKFGGHPPL